jgi:hypothetical protein
MKGEILFYMENSFSVKRVKFYLNDYVMYFPDTTTI